MYGKLAGLFPVKEHAQVAGLISWSGPGGRQPMFHSHMNVSLSLSLPVPLSLKFI